MRTWIALSIAMLSLCTLSSQAAAQDDYDDDRGRFDSPYFAAKLLLNFGGEGTLDGGPVLGVNTTIEDDLEPAYGLGLAYMHPVIEILALGGQLSVISWNSESAADADVDRNLLVDISFVPQLNFDIAIVELYASVPVGFTLDFIGDDTAFSNGAASASVGTGIGYHVGILIGARLGLTRSFGLLGEIGYMAHGFSHEVEGMVLGATATNDVDVTLGQLVLNLGLYF